MKRSWMASFVAVGYLTAAGAAQAQEGKGIRIAFIAKAEANAVFAAAELGAKAAAERLSKQRGTEIAVAVLTPPREDPAEQARRVAMAVEAKVAAIAIACSDATVVGAAVDAAVDAGVPVMTFDSDCGTKRFSHYGPDDEAAGATVMSELAKAISGSGRVAILAGNLEAPNLKARAAGAEKAGKELGLEVVGTYGHEEVPQQAAAEVMRVNRVEPNVAGWAMVGGWALFRSSATASLHADLEKRNQRVVSIDALPDQLHWVDKERAVLLAQPVYDWGRVSVETIVAKVLDGKEPPANIEMELVRVGPDTLGKWARQLRDWGFSGLPEQYLQRP